MALNDPIKYRLIYRLPGGGALRSVPCYIGGELGDIFLIYSRIEQDANRKAIVLEREVVTAIDDRGIIVFVAPHAKPGEIETVKRKFHHVTGITLSALDDLRRIEAATKKD